MKTVAEVLKKRGKYIAILLIIAGALGSIYIYNASITDNSSIFDTVDATYLRASGSVENNNIIISSEVSGKIMEIQSKEGENIKAGQIIARIENTGLDSQYEKIKTNLQTARQNVSAIEDKISTYKVQNEKIIAQAQGGYAAALAEYQKVIEGASKEEISLAEEALNQADINLMYIKENMDRSSALLAAQAISQLEYEEAQRNYQMAQSQYKAAKARLDMMRAMPTDSNVKIGQSRVSQAKSGYELAISSGQMQIVEMQNQLASANIQASQAQKEVIQSEAEIEKTLIRSPMDGVLNSIFFDKGEFVTSGKPVMEIYDPAKTQIQVYVSEENIGHVKIGQEVSLFVDSHPDQAFGAKVVRINNEAEFTPKNIQTKEERVNTVFKVKIEAQDSKGVIKPGIPVEVNIKIGEKEEGQ